VQTHVRLPLTYVHPHQLRSPTPHLSTSSLRGPPPPRPDCSQRPTCACEASPSTPAPSLPDHASPIVSPRVHRPYDTDLTQSQPQEDTELTAARRSSATDSPARHLCGLCRTRALTSPVLRCPLDLSRNSDPNSPSSCILLVCGSLTTTRFPNSASPCSRQRALGACSSALTTSRGSWAGFRPPSASCWPQPTPVLWSSPSSRPTRDSAARSVESNPRPEAIRLPPRPRHRPRLVVRPRHARRLPCDASRADGSTARIRACPSGSARPVPCCRPRACRPWSS
jgi:hypothetical protein